MSTIAKAIDAVVAAGLAPLLKAQGFRKSARTFHRTDAESIAVVNVQASSGNFGDTGKFTINVGRYFPAVAALEGARALDGLPREFDCTVRERIGTLRDGHDHWWTVSATGDNSVVVGELRNDFESIGLPWLERIATVAGLNAEPSSLPGLTAASVAVLAGDLGSASRRAAGFLAERPMARADIEAWARRNGVTLPPRGPE